MTLNFFFCVRKKWKDYYKIGEGRERHPLHVQGTGNFKFGPWKDLVANIGYISWLLASTSDHSFV